MATATAWCGTCTSQDAGFEPRSAIGQAVAMRTGRAAPVAVQYWW